MRYIDTWLSGLGLDYVIPKLKANGITTPKKLAALSLREIYEVGTCRFQFKIPVFLTVILMIFSWS
jgi:predicted flap endonuclease-1-like 5' DNA nuclease